MTLQEALKSGRWFFRKNYSGRFRFNLVTGKCEADYGKMGNTDHKFSAEEVLSNLYELEPCEHEPNYRRWNYNGKKPEGYDYGYDDECKHCGVKIKPEKWVEA